MKDIKSNPKSYIYEGTDYIDNIAMPVLKSYFPKQERKKPKKDQIPPYLSAVPNGEACSS